VGREIPQKEGSVKVVLIRRYNAPSIHRPECRFLKGKELGGLCYSLINLTDDMRDHVRWGYLKACKVCDPTGAAR
jgi:hypothetical protein